MTDKQQPSKPRGRPLPWMAVGITLVLLAIAVYQVVTSGHVDETLLGALVILAFGFAGYGGDRLLERLSGR